jgi:hypothetical protein
LWASFIADAAEEKVPAAIMPCLSKQHEQKAFREVLAAFFVAECVKFFECATDGMQAMFRTCGWYITMILNVCSPTNERTGDASFSTMLQACFGRLCSGSEAGASAASKKTLFVGVAASSKLQAVFAANTALFRDHDMFLMLTLSCLPSTQDRQRPRCCTTNVWLSFQ